MRNAGQGDDNARAMLYQQFSQKMFSICVRMTGDREKVRLTVTNDRAPRRFTSTVGNIKERHTRFELTCHSCTLDFK